MSVPPAHAEPVAPAPGAPAAPPGASRAARVASYTLSARLDATKHRIFASGSIELHNYTAVALSELYFHLYINAFKNDESLFLRSPFGAGRSGEHGTEWGYIDVKRLFARSLATDLWPARSQKSPGDETDETDVRVPLPKPLEPGATLSLDVEFEVQLPELVERTGYVSDFHFVAQWFPKLARLLPDGTFAHFAFHPQSEFSANFGDYDVTLEVPAGDVVGATGSCVSEPAAGAFQRLRCRARDVHDFAWTSWRGFHELTAQAGGVQLRVLAPPGHEQNAALELDSARFGLEYFGKRFGPYPYSTLTIVHPPDAAANAGGMEYPTLITTGGPWFTPYTGARAIEAVTLHELGHQWFYGLFASDEQRFPFLDEGLNSYAEAGALGARYGLGSSFAGAGLSISSEALSRVFSAARGADEPIAQPAGAFVSFRSLAAIVYSRTASLFSTLERVYGKPALDAALADYAAAARFRHPEPSTLLDAVRGRLGDDAARNLQRALFERGSVDYLVRDVQSAALDPRAGVFDESSGRRTLPRSELRPPARWAGRAVVMRHGSLELPLQIRLELEDGRSELRSWDGHGSSHVVEYEGASRLVGVTLDPELRVLLDDDLTNNVAAARDHGAPRAMERLLYFAELLLGGGLP